MLRIHQQGTVDCLNFLLTVFYKISKFQTNIRSSKHIIDSKSPLPQKHESLLGQHKSDTSPNSTIHREREKSGRSTLERVKEKDTGSPITAERRGRRFSYTNSK